MNHLNRIAAALPDHGLDAMLVTSEPGEFYAIGFHGEGYVLVTPKACFYSTDSRYIEAAKRVENAEVAMVGGDRNHAGMAAGHVKDLGLKKIGIEENNMSVAEYNRICAAMPKGTELIPAQNLTDSLRAVKDEEELAVMRQAEEIAEWAFTEVLNDIKVGVKESQIAARLTYLMMSRGASKNSFNPIVASGPNSSMPHAEVTERAVGSDEFVTLDFGAVFHGYCSDTTRTICVGRPTEEMARVYQVVLDAQQAGIAAAKAGVSGSAIHNAAHDVIRAAGYGDCFGHSFGHSLGIEVHENPGARPTNHDPMPANCVLSAEPGIYLPGRFGVRIEDVLLLTPDGNINLTAAPKELMIL